MAPPDPPDPADALAARRRTVLITAIGAVVAAALLFAIVAQAMTDNARSGGDAGDAGTTEFDVGPAEPRAAAVARDGPLLFPDPRGGSRDIYVQHLGDKNWVAFEARASGAPRRCVLRWEQSARHFVDPCDGRIFPADGSGLVMFPARVDDDDRVVVDLTSPRAPETSGATTLVR
ncbi:MAG TPA: hypothetical protein VHF27_11285 [Acidimicrobiales bacterium]|nr:hypothetical protein [Acidimicrobiales bacterium]